VGRQGGSYGFEVSRRELVENGRYRPCLGAQVGVGVESAFRQLDRWSASSWHAAAGRIDFAVYAARVSASKDAKVTSPCVHGGIRPMGAILQARKYDATLTHQKHVKLP